MRGIKKKRYHSLNPEVDNNTGQLLIYGLNKTTGRRELLLTYTASGGPDPQYLLRGILTADQIRWVEEKIKWYNPEKTEVQL